MISKSANQAYNDYKKGGGTLNFKTYIHQEKERLYSVSGDSNMMLVNQSLNDTVQTAVKNMSAEAGLKTAQTGNTIFGINKFVFIGGGVLITAAIIFLIVKNKKK